MYKNSIQIIIECTNIFRDRLIKNNENWIHFSRIVGHCRTLLTFQHWFTYRIYVYFFPLIVQIAMELVLQTVCVLFSYVFLSKQIVSKSFYSEIALKWREKRVSKASSLMDYAWNMHTCGKKMIVNCSGVMESMNYFCSWCTWPT